MSRRLASSAVLFDFYNTLVSIETKDDEEVWNRLARFIRYHGVDIEPAKLHDEFSAAMHRGIESSQEQYYQTDELGIFRSILAQSWPSSDGIQLASFSKDVALLFRVMSIRRFELFPDTLPALESLSGRFLLGVITDAQRVFLEPEMRMLGIARFFKVVVVSGDHDVHKPDPRLFLDALKQLDLPPERVTFVGDNAWRDIGGAKQQHLHAVLLDRKRTFDHHESTCLPDRVIHDLSELGHLLVKRTGVGR